MATPQGGTSLDAIATLLKLFQGEKTKTTETGGGFTETSKVTPNQDALVAILKSALESNQGLASVAQGQKTAGLYNSSTNRLLSNDLLSRLSGQAAIAASQGVGAEKTVTRTGTPATRTQVQGGIGGSNDMLSKLIMGMSAYQKLGGTKALKGLYTDAMGLMPSGASPTGNFPGVDVAQAMGAGATTPLGLDMSSQGPGLQVGSGIQYTPSFDALNFTPNMSVAGYGDILSDSFAGFTEDQIGNAPSADQFTVPTEAELSAGDTSANFPSAPSGNPSSANNPTAGETLEGATKASANTTSISSVNVNAPSTLGSVYSLYSGISQLTDDTGRNDVAGAANTASGAYSAYKGYQTYQTAAKAAEAANAASAAEGVQGTASAVDYMNFNWGSAGSGSALGYIGPVMSAIGAQRNPQGIHGKDYRQAVGSAVLNYFGWGWAAPIVHKVARPILDAAMDAGVESGGIVGAAVADPVGSLISGEYEAKDVVQAVLDPGNIFGGNPGGSVGSVVAYGIDPIGAALGDKGVFSVVSDSVNSVDKAIGGALGAPGRVVCTELALGGELPMEKYQQVIQPKITLKGRILLGYHVLGVPAVRKLRKDKKFRERALPYVNAYLDHKLGKHNWRGFLIKSIGEPLCWCLSFFNRDPDYYQTLYPYRRVRNG